MKNPKRLYIVVEGQTEAEFVESVLRPHFINKGIYFVEPVIIHTSKGHKGGFVRFQHLRNDVLKLLKQQSDVIVSTFVDFFRIPTSMPHYEKCMEKRAIEDKIMCLEAHTAASINDRRFIPYIQKHEFEALLFASNVGFEKYFEAAIFEKTQAIIDTYPNPEDINNNPQTAPSKRLETITQKNYDKINDGNTIALEIGIQVILEKCPRFKAWVEQLEVLILK